MRQSLAIKKENVDLEKQVNKLNKILVLNKSLLLLLFAFLIGNVSQTIAQERVPFDQGTKYILGDVDVTGKISFNKQTVVTFSGLVKGQQITVPGEEISNAIKKLSKLGLFNQIDFYVNRIEGDSIYLELKYTGITKIKRRKIYWSQKRKNRRPDKR